MVVTFTLMSESAGKHDFALGRTGTAPPTPALTTGEERDEVSDGVDRGADGFSIAPSAWVRAISCTYTGVPKSGQFPLSATYYVYQGSEDISEDPLTTYSLTTSNCVAALGGDNNRVLTISSTLKNSRVPEEKSTMSPPLPGPAVSATSEALEIDSDCEAWMLSEPPSPVAPSIACTEIPELSMTMSENSIARADTTRVHTLLMWYLSGRMILKLLINAPTDITANSPRYRRKRRRRRFTAQ